MIIWRGNIFKDTFSYHPLTQFYRTLRRNKGRGGKPFPEGLLIFYPGREGDDTESSVLSPQVVDDIF